MANGSLRNIKKTHIGTEVVYKDDYKDLHLTGFDNTDVIIRRIYNIDPRRAFIAFNYLMDMYRTFESVYKSLIAGGRYVIVVGNNLVRGIPFENWKYFIPMAKNVGFTMDLHFESEIIKHYIKIPRKERINSEHVLVFQK